MRLGRAGLVAAVVFTAGAFAVLSSTGPNPAEEASSVIRRHGGPCVRLDEWGLFGWKAVGATETITDTQQARWSPITDTHECQPAPTQTYLIRLPRGGPDGVYRLCGMADSEPCLEFRRVPFDPGEPGP